MQVEPFTVLLSFQRWPLHHGPPKKCDLAALGFDADQSSGKWTKKACSLARNGLDCCRIPQSHCQPLRDWGQLIGATKESIRLNKKPSRSEDELFVFLRKQNPSPRRRIGR